MAQELRRVLEIQTTKMDAILAQTDSRVAVIDAKLGRMRRQEERQSAALNRLEGKFQTFARRVAFSAPMLASSLSSGNFDSLFDTGASIGAGMLGGAVSAATLNPALGAAVAGLTTEFYQLLRHMKGEWDRAYEEVIAMKREVAEERRKLREERNKAAAQAAGRNAQVLTAEQRAAIHIEEAFRDNKLRQWVAAGETE